MKLSVIMPVYNEPSRVVHDALWKAWALLPDAEIIIVDDGSDIPYRPELTVGMKYFAHSHNLGKGAAIRTGLKHATGDLVIIQDADGELDPAEIPKLVELYEERDRRFDLHNDFGGASFKEVVYGARLNISWGARLITWLTNKYLDTNLSDVACGYKLMPTQLLRDLNTKSNRFPWCFEVTAKLVARGYRIRELLVSYHPRKKGKKLKWWDGFGCLWALLKYRTV